MNIQLDLASDSPGHQRKLHICNRPVVDSGMLVRLNLSPACSICVIQCTVCFCAIAYLVLIATWKAALCMVLLKPSLLKSRVLAQVKCSIRI